jgi:hypothetical protein
MNRKFAKAILRERAAARAAERRQARPPDFDVGDTIRSESGDCFEVVGVHAGGRTALIQRLVDGTHEGEPFRRAIMSERGVKICEGEFARRVPAETSW